MQKREWQQQIAEATKEGNTKSPSLSPFSVIAIQSEMETILPLPQVW